MDAGRSLVTANKALLATHGLDIEATARCPWRPGALRRPPWPGAGAGAARHGPRRGPHRRGPGHVNGTTNHILTAMACDARGYADVPAEAQARGYAEADRRVTSRR
ncbi:MAG: hypothetical protein R3C32_06425 [Chloroflexota bacterium]